jgi:hypothetical protein
MQVLTTIVGFITLLVLVTLVFALPTMLLWDWLMPELFGLKEITLFQAWGLNFLCGILFKTNGSSGK